MSAQLAATPHGSGRFCTLTATTLPSPRRQNCHPCARTILLAGDPGPERAVLRTVLNARYAVLETRYGPEALEYARAAEPCLLVSRVALDGLDGYQLCRAIKEDTNTRRIAVVLVTDHGGGDSRATALGAGADCVLAQPVGSSELVMQIDNLVQRCGALRGCGAALASSPSLERQIPLAEELFLRTVITTIEAHLEDPALDVRRLARAVGFSRSQLHRRVRALTHQSPSALIRSGRLQKAAHLLMCDAGSVAEVAYTVGFSSHSYFATCFRQQFNCSPKQFRASRKGAGVSFGASGKEELRLA
jgi:AraC-like DNA-binding protein